MRHGPAHLHTHTEDRRGHGNAVFQVWGSGCHQTYRQHQNPHRNYRALRLEVLARDHSKKAGQLAAKLPAAGRTSEGGCFQLNESQVVLHSLRLPFDVLTQGASRCLFSIPVVWRRKPVTEGIASKLLRTQDFICGRMAAKDPVSRPPVTPPGVGDLRCGFFLGGTPGPNASAKTKRAPRRGRGARWNFVPAARTER